MARGGSGGRGGRGNAPGGTSGSGSSRANSSAGPHSRRPSAAASKGPPTTPKAGAEASSAVSTPTAASAADADAAWAALSADAERVDWAAEPTAIKSAPRPTLPTSASTPALARVPSPNGSAAPDIASLVGLSLRLTYAHDKAAPPSSIEGLLWCYDAHTGFIALECASSQPSGRDYRLVKLALVRSVQVLQPTPTPNALAVPDALSRPVNIAGIRAAEASAVRAEEQRLSRRGPKGTTAWAQAIFDALAKTLPVRWNGTSIVVLDEVVVKPPYAVSDCSAPLQSGTGAQAGQPRLERVHKVLEGERARLLRSNPELAPMAAAAS